MDDKKEFVNPFQKTILASLREALISTSCTYRCLKDTQYSDFAWSYYIKIRDLYEDFLQHFDFD